MSHKSLPELSRDERAAQLPLVPELPEAPGIRVAMGLSPKIGEHLRGLADAVLVDEFPGSTLSRFDREVLATVVSSANGCFFCADSHAAHAMALTEPDNSDALLQVESAKACDTSLYGEKMRRLSEVALNVQGLEHDYDKESADVELALQAGATPQDVQLTVAVAATFSMYNRFVEGFRAPTPPDVSMYEARAHVIAENGYAG